MLNAAGTGEVGATVWAKERVGNEVLLATKDQVGQMSDDYSVQSFFSANVFHFDHCLLIQGVARGLESFVLASTSHGHVGFPLPHQSSLGLGKWD